MGQQLRNERSRGRYACQAKSKSLPELEKTARQATGRPRAFTASLREQTLGLQPELPVGPEFGLHGIVERLYLEIERDLPYSLHLPKTRT